jgi:hypothetical protein
MVDRPERDAMMQYIGIGKRKAFVEKKLYKKKQNKKMRDNEERRRKNKSIIYLFFLQKPYFLPKTRSFTHSHAFLLFFYRFA